LLEKDLGAAANGVAVVDDEHLVAGSVGAHGTLLKLSEFDVSNPQKKIAGSVALCHASDFDHFKVFLASSTLGTGPVHRHISPGGAGRNAIFRNPDGLVVDPPANKTHPSLVVHRSLRSLFIECNDCIETSPANL
jgi:hypothetical protein